MLEGEHGYIKTFIYELNEMGPNAPNWLEKVREFRAAGRRAMRIWRRNRSSRASSRRSTRSRTTEITSLVNRDGFWMA